MDQNRDAGKWLRLGRGHHEAGRWLEAARCYQRVLSADPNHDEALYLLGGCVYQSGQPAQAAAIFQRALALRPGDAQCEHALGLCLLAMERRPEAEASFRRAVEADPANAEATVALGALLRSTRQSLEAVAVLRQARTLLPADPNVCCDLGNALQDLGRHREALVEYAAATKLAPGLARGWYELGCAHLACDEIPTAARHFREAGRLAPGWFAARQNLAAALIKLGQVDEAIEVLVEATSGPDAGLALATIALIIPGSPQADNQRILEARRTWGQYASGSEARAGAGARRASRPGERLRVGYVSSFFQRENWMKPVWSLLNHHQRGEFEIHLFSDAPAAAIKHGYTAHPADHFHDISGWSNEAAAAEIARADLNVLVDLNGYSATARLPLYARRPAPVLVGWFNLYATTGLPSFDYLIGDATVIPPEEEKFYGETIRRVSGSYLAFEVNYPVPEVAPPPNSEAVVFGCLAPLYKITFQAVTAWCQILERVPGATLLLKNTALGNRDNREYLEQLFAAGGIKKERLRLEGPADHYQFLEAYGQIDLALDTFPYNGGTTTMEAIWQGVPVVAFRGDRWVSRISASILGAGGLERFVAGSLEEYMGLAARWAAAREELATLRREMRTNLRASPVCAGAAFAREMEQIYREICRPGAG